MNLIETGGTICMAAGPDGLHPALEKVRDAIVCLAPQLDLHEQALLPLVDSADVGPALWNDLLERIAAVDGPVLITHGTDTMAFTGAALDAALAGLGRSVVLCGAMQPLGTEGGDAEGNLALAIRAAQDARPGVALAFAGRLWPAGQVTKIHATADEAFQVAGETAAAPVPPARRFNLSLALGVLTISPGLQARSLRASLSGLDGAVLRVFGAGTLPAGQGLAEVLAEAVARGCVITAVSQTLAGGLAPGTYAAGAALWQAGVQNGGALSVEQALTRLWLRLSAQS